MTDKTSDETQRPYTVVFRDWEGDTEAWHVFALTAKAALGAAQAYALHNAWSEGLDITWGGLGLEVVSITEGHHLELLYHEVDPKKHRKVIRAAMRATFEAIAHGDA